jgi:hypothetical protein
VPKPKLGPCNFCEETGTGSRSEKLMVATLLA